MKTTIELPDELLVAAKQRAAELRCTLNTLVERGLRKELQQPRSGRRRRRRIHLGHGARWGPPRNRRRRSGVDVPLDLPATVIALPELPVHHPVPRRR